MDKIWIDPSSLYIQYSTIPVIVLRVRITRLYQKCTESNMIIVQFLQFFIDTNIMIF